MQDSDIIIKKLKEKGRRFSNTRKTILDLLIKIPKPLSSPDLQILFLKRGMGVNKTTIYRELSFLKEQNIVRELQFGDNTKRYEIMPDNHHHHIVCVNCEKIEDVELKRDLDREEKVIAQNKNFKVLHHSLEFFGICGKCQDQQAIRS